ncbi:MAG: SGNH/GDSL hydrolase family protein [Pirellulales bacterium]
MTEHAETRPSRVTRRDFVLAGAGITAASLASLAAAQELAQDRFFLHIADKEYSLRPSEKALIEPGNTILFQGDSITDAGRNRDTATKANSRGAMGNGYAWLAAAQLLVDMPDAGLKIFNRGISGDKVFQLADRWQADCLDIKPDVLSILVGVNDFAHVHKHGYEGTLEKYETDYQALLKRTKEALPKVRLIICEPFVLKVGVVDDTWIEPFAGYRAAARRVADEAGAAFVPFQTMFDAAAKIAPPAHWAADGVHPSVNGAALMAHWWLRAAGV